MAATLAFGGLNPVDRRARRLGAGRARCDVDHGQLRHVRLLREWMLRVGLPAKRGVSGGVMAVAPSQFGVAASARDWTRTATACARSAIVEILADRFGMHLLELHESVAAPGDLGGETARGAGRALGGELGFAGAERVLSHAAGDRRGLSPRRGRSPSMPLNSRGSHPGRARSRSRGDRRPGARVPPAGVSERPPLRPRRSSVIDMASVLCRCGHSWARPEPSVLRRQARARRRRAQRARHAHRAPRWRHQIRGAHRRRLPRSRQGAESR